MTLSIRPLRWDERAWLHTHAVANFAELAPELAAPGNTHYDTYWSDPDREPLAVIHSRDRVGFSLIRRIKGGLWELAEFYLLPEHRRRGLGRAAARAILCARPGPWILGVARQGKAAAFWEATLTGADWLTDLEIGAPFYPAQTHSYTFTTLSTAQERAT